jgi:(p)ppGpp synthase/HD superfamily hydrolase
METTLNKVYEFAASAHAGQMRKYTPDPYIVHPVRVMEICRQYKQRLPILAAALLHDVIEDTSVSTKGLSLFLHEIMPSGSAAETLQLVIDLTDVYVKSAYPQLNRRRRKEKELERLLKISPDAQTVKYADILDNTSEIVTSDPGFAPRYLRECLSILNGIKDGNTQLRTLALNAVTERLDIIKKKRPETGR